MNKNMTEVSTRILKLRDKSRSLPTKPGCYLMKNSKDKILYVGKAKSLKPRVSSYFQNSVKSPKTEILVSHIYDFEFILTENEAEALILENNLIKKHTPKYNILMRDDRSYPYVVVDEIEEFPRLLYQRRVVKKSGVTVFGPFVHGSNISDVLRIVIKSFQLRDCTNREFNSRKEPCLLYQIKQCSAPCVGKISEQNYRKDLALAKNIFDAKAEQSIAVLENRMNYHAENLDFEHAAIIRDNIEVLKNFLSMGNQENVELLGDHRDVDVLSYHVGDIEIDISLYMVRNGLLLGHKNFHFPKIDCEEEVESEVINFIYQYYSSEVETLPKLIISEFNSHNHQLFNDVLKVLGEISLCRPNSQKGDFTSLYKLTQEYAKENQRVRIKNEDSVYIGLNKLEELLQIIERPVLLECYDIAIFQGSSPTASQIVFRDGRADKKNYRYYHLETRPEGNNDFEMMKEVLRRRLKKGNLPDVFIVDGGKGQQSSFQSILKEFDIDIPVCALAKAKTQSSFKKEDIKKTEERLFIPGRLNPYVLNKNKSLMKILVSMRDEAHRFSRKLHHKAEKKRIIANWLDEVSGLGPKVKKQMMEKMDITQAEVLAMSPEEIAEYFDIKINFAKKILNQFNI